MTPGWRCGALRSPRPMNGPRPLVLKIGGSLLSRAGWPRQIDDLIAGFGETPLSLVVGGGAVVDGLRLIDAAAPQPARLMHDLAIDAMRLTALVVSRTTGLPLSAQPACTPTACVLDVPLWLQHSGNAANMPAGWHVTSDSIAACVARACNAALLLAKSVPPPSLDHEPSLADLARAGWVDPFFATATIGLDDISWAVPDQ